MLPLVAEVMGAARPDLRLRALAAALARPDRSHAALRRALVLWASEPEHVAAGLVPEGMALAFAVAHGNADLLRLYVPRALALVAAFPDRAADFPAPQALRDTAGADPGSDPASDLPAHLRADLRDGLHALAHAVEGALAGTPPMAAPRRETLGRTKARVA